MSSSPSIVLMRHAERLDRSLESLGKDWIHSSPRPQDSPLSPSGLLQAQAAAQHLRMYDITTILTSPMIRTVQTAHAIAEGLGLGPGSVCVEPGLVEEAKSFRGKTSDEPLPCWDPLVLSVDQLKEYSPFICDSYEPLYRVEHVRDDDAPNTVREVHDTLTDPDEVTRDRCRVFIDRLLEKVNACFNDSGDSCSGYTGVKTVLCVGHGASVGACAAALERSLPDELRIKGKRGVGSWARYVPYTAAVNNESSPQGLVSLGDTPWYAPSGMWEENSGILSQAIVDCAVDRGEN